MFLGKIPFLPGIALVLLASGGIDAKTYQLKKVMVIRYRPTCRRSTRCSRTIA